MSSVISYSGNSSSAAKHNNLTMTSSLPSSTDAGGYIGGEPSKNSESKNSDAKPPITNTIIPSKWSFKKDLQVQNTFSNPDDDRKRAVGDYPSSIRPTSILLNEDCD